MFIAYTFLKLKVDSALLLLFSEAVRTSLLTSECEEEANKDRQVLSIEDSVSEQEQPTL